MFGKKTKKISEEKISEEKKAREVSIFREYFELFAETLVYVFFVMTFLLQSFVIPTGSMQNNILIGDHLLVNKVAYSRSQDSIDDLIFPQKKITRGSVVTFKAPAEMDKEYVKRVIGLPGETIKINNKKVYINGQLLDEPYVHFDGAHISGGYGDNFPLQQPRYIDVLGKISFLPFYINDPNGYIDAKKTTAVCDQFKDAVIDEGNEKVFKVPEGYYFCMGDNRDHSYDSRFWGPVPANYIIGKPWRVYWSYESSTEDYLTPGIQHKLKDIALTVINFFSKTRWNRTIMKIQ